MGTIRLEMTLTIKGEEFDAEVEVEYDYTSGEDAVITGPWENCHPGSPPEIELISCKGLHDGVDYTPHLSEKDKEYLEYKICEHEQDAEPDPPEPEDREP